MNIVPKWKKPKNPGSCQVEFEQTLLKLLGHLCVFVSEFQTQSITQTSLLHCGQSIGNYSLDATGSRPSLKESYDSICSSFISGGWVQQLRYTHYTTGVCLKVLFRSAFTAGTDVWRQESAAYVLN